MTAAVMVPLLLDVDFVEFQSASPYGGIPEGQPNTEKPARVAGE